MMDKMKTLWSKTNRWHRGLVIFLIIELRLLPGGQLGFMCNDPALSHPFTGDTITWKHLFGVILLLPLAVMLIVERTCHPDLTIKPKKQALRWYKEYLFGVLFNLIVVQSIKLIVGSPRPHFFDTCSPKEALTCQGSEYVPRYTCMKAHWLSQSDKSFPSGHSSLAVHAGIFLAYYLYKRAANCKLTMSTQALLLLSTLYCAISRMTDHRHHWWDVLGGVTIAVPILFYTIFYLCRNFEAPNVEKECKSDINDSRNLDVSNDAQLINTMETSIK